MKKVVITLLMCMLLLSGCGSESEEFLELADQYFAEGQYDHAAYNYVRALELARENKDAYMNLIDSYMAQGKLDDAMDYLEETELMFGARTVEDKRALLEEMMPEPTPRKDEPTPTEVPVVEEAPIPEVTIESADVSVVEPTEVPEPTATSAPDVEEIQNSQNKEIASDLVFSEYYQSAKDFEEMSPLLNDFFICVQNAYEKSDKLNFSSFVLADEYTYLSERLSAMADDTSGQFVDGKVNNAYIARVKILRPYLYVEYHLAKKGLLGFSNTENAEWFNELNDILLDSYNEYANGTGEDS